MDTNDYFISSLSLDQHPMKKEKKKKRRLYYFALDYFLKQVKMNDISKTRLEWYKLFLIGNAEDLTDINPQAIIKFLHWRRRKKYRYMLICDMALILLDKTKFENAVEILNACFSKKITETHARVLTALMDINSDVIVDKKTNYLISQYRMNFKFMEKQKFRCIVTANISAGKSTLINAIIGKTVARTAADACTGNVCYFYNKPFEDGHIHLNSSVINLSASDSDLRSFEWNRETGIASYFRELEAYNSRICIIDTPGVDHGRDKHQGEITHKAILNEKYDKLVYVLKPPTGTESDKIYISRIASNVPKEKVVFVLNRIDELAPDEISRCIENVRLDLKEYGFENPIVCPMSCEFALFLQMDHYSDSISEMQQDCYEHYLKVFNSPMYDLTKYYPESDVKKEDSEYQALLKKCGLYGLKKILFGGNL